MIALPPHCPWELDRARRNVCAAVQAAIRAGAPVPSAIIEAAGQLDALESANAAVAELRRQENFAYPMHYVYELGDKRVLCGELTDDVRHGWIGVDREFLRRRHEHGGNVCIACLTALDHRTEQQRLPL